MFNTITRLSLNTSLIGAPLTKRKGKVHINTKKNLKKAKKPGGISLKASLLTVKKLPHIIATIKAIKISVIFTLLCSQIIL
jgi:hypothetical protein